MGTDWGLVASMLLTIALLAALYLGFFGVFALLGAALPGVILAALLVLAVQYLNSERLMLRSVGLASFEPGVEDRRRPVVRALAWILLLAALPLVLDTMAGMTWPLAATLANSVALLLIGLVIWGAGHLARRWRGPPAGRVLQNVAGLPADTLDRLAMLAGCGRPRLLCVADRVPYAMAVGLSPNRGAIIISQGLLGLGLTGEELEGVLAHELAHLIHHDSRLMVVAGTLGMLIGTAGAGVTRAFSAGGSGGDGGSGGGGGGMSEGTGEGAAAIIIVIILAIVFLALVYLVDFLLTRTLSRYRELAADRGAATITSHPEALAGALVKIRQAINGQTPADLRLVKGASALMICPAHAMPEPAKHPVHDRAIKENLEATGYIGGFSAAAALVAGALIWGGNGWGWVLAVFAGLGLLSAAGLLVYVGAEAAWHRVRPEITLWDEMRILTSTHPSVERRVALLQSMAARLAGVPQAGADRPAS